MLRETAIAFSLAAIVGIGACGGGDSGGRPDAKVFGEVCTPGGTFDINGRAAVLANLNVHVNASGLVEVNTTAELLLALDVDQSGSDLGVTAELCVIKIPEIPLAGQDQPIIFDVPNETVASVGTVSGTGTLSSPNQTCATLQSDQFALTIGAILDPIESALLPTADDNGDFSFCAPTVDTACDLAIGVNCACDQEGDGKAGATLRAMNVPAVDLDEVYVTMRTMFSLTGEVYSSDLIIGQIDASIEQGILGCHLASGNACNPDQIGAVKMLNPVITQQPGNLSTFRGVRVPDGTTCADIIDQRDTLFPR